MFGPFETAGSLLKPISQVTLRRKNYLSFR
jgi:hypothetical protein